MGGKPPYFRKIPNGNCGLHWAQCPSTRRSLRRLWTPVSKPRSSSKNSGKVRFGGSLQPNRTNPTCLGWFGVKVGRDETSQITFLSVLEDEMLRLTNGIQQWRHGHKTSIYKNIEKKTCFIFKNLTSILKSSMVLFSTHINQHLGKPHTKKNIRKIRH